MAKVSDYGNVVIGEKTSVNVPIEKDIFDKVIASEFKICTITNLIPSGKNSVWVTFTTEEGLSFAQLKRINTKVLIY